MLPCLLTTACWNRDLQTSGQNQVRLSIWVDSHGFAIRAKLRMEISLEPEALNCLGLGVVCWFGHRWVYLKGVALGFALGKHGEFSESHGDIPACWCNKTPVLASQEVQLATEPKPLFQYVTLAA